MGVFSNASLLIEPIGKDNIEEISELYFRRGPFLSFRKAQIVEEYLKRNVASRNYLHGYAIKKLGRIVGSSCMVRVGRNTALLLFTVTDESFSGIERMAAFGKTYRETIKTLIAKGISSVLSAATRDNEAIIDYCLSMGYIQFAEVGERLVFETYQPHLASSLSSLSGVGLDDISLLKLAQIAANPKLKDNSSYTFDFEFKKSCYQVKVDKLSGEIEALSSPMLCIGFRYFMPEAPLGDERFDVSFDMSNPTDHVKEFKCTLKAHERGVRRIVLRETKLLSPGSSASYALDIGVARRGSKSFVAEVAVDGKRFRLSKTFAIQRQFRVIFDASKTTADRTTLSIRNVAGQDIVIKLRSASATRPPIERILSIPAGVKQAVEIPSDGGLRKRTKQKVELQAEHGNAATVIKVSRSAGVVHFTDGETFACSNGHLIMEIEKHSVIVSFYEAGDPEIRAFQLPEEIGPPFTEYEFNRFQSLPTSCWATDCFSDRFSSFTDGRALKPRVSMNPDGLVMRHRVEGRTGLLMEKRLSFKGKDAIEIQPRLVNISAGDIHTKIAFRTYLKIQADTIIRVPIYRDSFPTRSLLSKNPYYIDELLLKGERLTENWTTFEFSDTKKCVGLIWHGNPTYDFFPVWFNKMPWLMYDVELGNGQAITLPPHTVVFTNFTDEGNP